uniref:Hyp19 n=1 Tax=Elaeophora elaphi TaxID=1147741 RepID=A0A0R3RMP7_9BILA
TTTATKTATTKTTTTTKPELLTTTIHHPNDQTTTMETSVLNDDKSEQIPEEQANSGTAVETESDKINQTSTAPKTVMNSVTDLENDKDTKATKALSDFIPNTERNRQKKVTNEQSAEVELIQKKKRKKCFRHDHGSRRKCSYEDNVSVEVTIPTPDTEQKKPINLCDSLKTFINFYRCNNDQSRFHMGSMKSAQRCYLQQEKAIECRMSTEEKVSIQNVLKESNMYLGMIETSENIDRPEQNVFKKNDAESFHRSSKINETRQPQVGDWRKEKTEDLLLRAVQEYQAYLKNQGKERKTNK